VMVEVGNKLLGRFADCLAEEIGVGSGPAVAAPVDEGATQAVAPPGVESAAPAAAAAATAPPVRSMSSVSSVSTGQRSTGPAFQRDDNDAIDLIDVGGAAVLKRAAPLLGGLLVLFVLWRLIRRR